MASSVVCRAARAEDRPGIAAVAAATGQPPADSGADPAYLDLLLATGTVFVAASDRGILGWGAVRPGRQGSLLTDLFVHPDAHGTGVGGRLLHALWPAGAAGARYTFSSTHPSALPLYVRAGLTPGWPLLYVEGPPPEAQLIAEPGDAAAAEAELTGAAPRSADYAYWGGGVVIRAGGQLAGAGAVRPGAVVHLVADPALATPALLAAAAAAGGDVVAACLPGAHPAVRRLLAGGWRICDFDVSMTGGGAVLPLHWAYHPGLT